MCFVTLWAWSSSFAYSVPNDRPNIVFLLTDDQARITIGAYGNPDVQTPNMDQLARDGVIFDRHYVTTGICMASRANIMTGLLEFRTGCNFTRGKMTPNQWMASYPLLLRKNGYLTAFAGKFGFEVEGMGELPSKDFDAWGGGPGQTNFATAKNPSMADFAKEFPHSSRAYGAFAQKFIRESVKKQTPFCVSISFKASHRPVTPDPVFDHVYANTKFKKPENYGRQSGQHFAEQSRTGRQYPRFEEWGYADNYNQVMQKYNQQVYGVDVALKMIREELEKQGVADNTVIIFTSDNGFMCGSHGYGSKVIPYEESMCVPLIIFDPRNSDNGRRCDALTGSIDLPMTMLEMAGVNQPENVDGASLVPLLKQPDAEVRKSLPIMNFWGPESTHYFGVVTPKFKYLYWFSQENGMTASEELFDMRGDRLEATSLVDDDHLDDLNEMRALYEKHRYEINDNAINDEYRIYNELFDRKIPWDRKQELLKSQKKKSTEARSKQTKSRKANGKKEKGKKEK